MNPVAKWILIANMLFGRLEVFTCWCSLLPSGANNGVTLKTLILFLPGTDKRVKSLLSGF
jgi:hypothetical protein